MFLGSCASFGKRASGWKLVYVAVSGSEVWISTLPLEVVVPELLVLVLVPLPGPELPGRDDAAAEKSYH